MSTTEKPTSTNYQELTIIAKMETLTNQVYPRLRRWPRHERYALNQEVRNGLTDFMSVMHMANKVVSKRTQYAQEADGILSGLKVKFRLAYSQKYISEGFHDIISIELSEIGKLLVNYIKTSSRVRNKKYSKEEYSEENKNDNNESE